MSKIKRNLHSSEEFSSSSCSTSSLSSDEETDAKDLKPIKDYLSDRRELARQLFKSVKPEKIRMMLPQILKKVSLNELEELCANELSGMSKARIVAILSGKDMAESSDTTESDDSGPSLEIISDTEEWFTEDDVTKKEDGTSGKVKGKKDKGKGKHLTQKKVNIDRLKAKQTLNKEMDEKLGGVIVKSEQETEKNKHKEGDSLLDLLELEMRARAIRALIRKEEDIIPNANSSKSEMNNGGSARSNSGKTAQDDQKEKENCRRQLEQIINAQQASAEDEDVVLVVEPTPTIELLSSDSETESNGGARVNKKLENERIAASASNAAYESGTALNCVNKNVSNRKTEAPENDTGAEKNTGTSKQMCSARINSNSIDSRNDASRCGDTEERKKKSHKRTRMKDRGHAKISKLDKKSKTGLTNSEGNTSSSPNNTSVDSQLINSNEDTNSRTGGESEEQVSNESVRPIEIKKEKSPESAKKTSFDEDKSIDMEEIIDLDDYSHDMDDIENYVNDKSKSTEPIESKEHKSQPETTTVQKSNSAETWASRYYQTDDVQNVIKESKIQSEIRKRLRERQRLSKLNKCPSAPSPTSSSTSEISSDKSVLKPTGSVDEYLALKQNHNNKGSTDVSSQDGTLFPNPQTDQISVTVESTSPESTDLKIQPCSIATETTEIKLNNETNPT